MEPEALMNTATTLFFICYIPEFYANYVNKNANWYNVLEKVVMIMGTGFALGYAINIKNDALIISSFKISSLLLDSLKKKLFYNKNISFDLFSTQCKSLFHNMCVFCEVNGIDVNSILHTNIEKLKARYGDKFSSHRAINRDLEKERTILEQ